MSFFDQAYDDMSWKEICYRLPSDLAISALKRRINNIETLKMFFDNIGTQPVSVKALKEHINLILSNEKTEDIMNIFEKNYESTLFNWLDNNNRTKIRDNESDKLSTQFLFNVTDSNNREGLKRILDRVLAEKEINQGHLLRVLGKADNTQFIPLLDIILKDSRPEVRAIVLGEFGMSNKNLISDHQKVIGLKALAKCTGKSLSNIGILNVNIFSGLRPAERLVTLQKYLTYFPKFKKIKVFDPVPTKEEFNIILFAGCIEHNDLVIKINKMYIDITEANLPKSGEGEK